MKLPSTVRVASSLMFSEIKFSIEYTKATEHTHINYSELLIMHTQTRMMYL
jgi:hypothetical protein